MRITAAATAACALLAACGGGGEESLSELAVQGKKTYRNVCIACHAANPNEDGTLGPAIAGSSIELLHARVVRGEYPPGYTPKRPSQAMPAFPYLEDEIPALAAYLAESVEATDASGGS